MGMVKLLFSTAHNPDSAISKVENYYSVTRHAAITQEALHFLGLEQKRKLIGGPGAANCGSSGSDEYKGEPIENRKARPTFVRTAVGRASTMDARATWRA
ncbi:hypothetical protein OOU_Y34scaffold01196g5 [Pyricularia oryzae Y34]|uniref:Uncharacterized protein n=2 Tax=Pyricularia oryzae TaxID=318829 RepID=A0AA97PF46_PYRO3|nr:hypothetical protein OOU_Y34scaffold01196g5 [Pyricularia oryzae Y34]